MKYFVVLALALLIISSSYAQISKIDFMLGSNTSFARGSDFNKDFWDSRISVTGGVGVDYSVANNSSITIKVLYENKGFIRTDKINYTDENNIPVEANVTIKLNIAYINVPLLYGYRFGNKIKFNVEAGPYLGIYLYDNLSADIEGLSNVEAAQLNSNTTDFGLCLGFNAYFPVSNKLSLKAGLQDYLGLNDISGGSSSLGKLKSNTLALQLGISLNLDSSI